MLHYFVLNIYKKLRKTEPPNSIEEHVLQSLVNSPGRLLRMEEGLFELLNFGGHLK